MRKTLFILTGHSDLGKTGEKTGYFLSEVTHPYYELTQRGLSVEFATIHGGPAPMDPSSYLMEDGLNRKFVDSPTDFQKVQNTFSLRQLNLEEFDSVFFPGGHGTVFDLPKSTELASLVAKIYESGGIVGAVCHGPAGLLQVKLSNRKWLVDGKRINSFTNDEEFDVQLENVVPFLLETELKKRGALFEKAGIQEEKVVCDERIITGQNPASARPLGRELALAIVKLRNQ